MKRSPTPVRSWMIALILGLSVCSYAQDVSPSLGDIARKIRKEHSSASHVPAKQVTNEEEDGPDAGGVWRVRLCSRTPCYELSIALPKDPRWIRPTAAPRPVLIPLLGHEDDMSHAIRVYAAESIAAPYPALDVAKRTFLQGWFARPEYFGQGARLTQDERIEVEGGQGVITHFTVISGGIKFRGLGVVATAPNGNYGFACTFLDEDTNTAHSICDAIVRSAHGQLLEPSRVQVYPNYYPPYYPRYDDPPDNDDP
jgi:hypothetical protein